MSTPRFDCSRHLSYVGHDFRSLPAEIVYVSADRADGLEHVGSSTDVQFLGENINVANESAVAGTASISIVHNDAYTPHIRGRAYGYGRADPVAKR